MTSYAALAQSTGIALPGLFQHLLSAGLADYGTNPQGWAADWKAHTLAARPVLSCVYDFEWITAADAQEGIQEWLNPAFQQGRRFLPFAQTGAGDLYCLTPLAANAQDGELGVALVWHDDDASAIRAASFDAFVFDALVQSTTDVSHLIDEGFTRAEAAQCVIANIQALAPRLPAAMQAPLERVAQSVAQHLPIASAGEAGSDAGSDAGPDALSDDALISADGAQAALAILPVVQRVPFPIRARWECGED